MRRSIALAFVFALVATACASSPDAGDSDATTVLVQSTTTTEGAASDGDETSTTSDAGGSETTTTTESTSPPPEGPAAPDFTLALGEDGAESFVLSQEVMPVFMVFWAEW